jgi:hypothetical protein
LRITGGIHAALFEEIVLQLFEDEGAEVPDRLAPVRCPATFEPDELDRESVRSRTCEGSGRRARVVASSIERMLELVVRQRLDFTVVPLRDRLEKRLARIVAGEPVLD